MRLTQDQIAGIRQATAKSFGEGSRVWLFGSRVDDERRGGDIDLLILPTQPAPGPEIERKIRFLGQLEKSLGERKIDVIIEAEGDRRPIVRLAHETGVSL